MRKAIFNSDNCEEEVYVHQILLSECKLVAIVETMQGFVKTVSANRIKMLDSPEDELVKILLEIRAMLDDGGMKVNIT